jgi:hypothetical protein
MVPAAVSCGSSYHLFRRREHHLRTPLFPEPGTMAQLDRRWQATTVEKSGGGDGFNPFGAHRVGIHRATASPVNERPAMMLSACR